MLRPQVAFVGMPRSAIFTSADASAAGRPVDRPRISANGERQVFVRLDNPKMDSRNPFKLAEEIYVDLQPRFTLVHVPRGELPNHRRIPVSPYKERDDTRRDQAADDRAEHGERNAVPGIRDHARLRHAEDEASRDERPEEDGNRV